jgi:hypothetical protein
METIKRHLFLVALGGGVAVIALAVGLLTYFGYAAPNAKLQRSYDITQDLATKMKQSPIFTADLVADMAKQDDLRKSQYADLLSAIRKEGAARKPLVAGVFPTTTDSGKRLNFKNKYDVEIQRFAKELQAVPAPYLEKDAVRAEEGLMYIHPKMSFYRPDWVEKAEAPSIEKVREGQENLWLMEDVVGIIKKMNEDLRAADPQLKDQRPTQANSAVKEINEIRIGADYATLTGSKMSSSMGRYMLAAPQLRKADEKGDKKDAKEPEKAEAPPRAPTLSGRWSEPGFYQVLPFRMVLVVESRYTGELIRRLKGTESFISVAAVRIKPLGDNSKEMMAPRSHYGMHQAIDRLEVVAESLLFQLEGGRVTTAPAKPAAPAPTKSK